MYRQVLLCRCIVVTPADYGHYILPCGCPEQDPGRRLWAGHLPRAYQPKEPCQHHPGPLSRGAFCEGQAARPAEAKQGLKFWPWELCVNKTLAWEPRLCLWVQLARQ